ncbi:sensor histidine kinase [Paenibacillaceae bacterium WGS1546]|uniref:cache domain-containing sensor histidine kinase n=1 Tax=Cohnella sp. WGS1546 TaxID=3366810 RepID=UPI00372D7E45
MESLFKKYRINQLYFWTTTIFITVIFAIVIWTSYYFSVKDIIANTSTYQERTLTDLNHRLQIQFDQIESVSLSVARNNELLGLLSSPKEPYLNFVAARNVVASLNTLTFSTPSILDIRIYMDDAPESGAEDVVQFADMNELKSETWYPLVENSDFTWVGAHRTSSYKGEVSVVSFVRKLTTIAGDYKGVVAIDVLTSEVQRWIQDRNEASNRMLLDKAGSVITYVGNEPIESRNAPYLAQINEQLESTNFAAQSGKFQYYSKALLVWTNLSDQNWLIIEVTPLSQLVQGSRNTAQVLVTVGIFAVLVLILIFWYLNRRLTKPIHLLVNAMKQYSLSAVKAELPHDYQNEFGQLYQNFTKLIDRIEDLYESLRIQYDKQKESEIKALQAMINPHFLYNTLDQLNWMAIKDKNAKMSKVLELTGRMLRIGLSNGESLIPIASELEQIECYMNIQQICKNVAIRYTLDFPEPLPACYIPKMTLQPIVENCIKHGFHGRTNGEIRIEGRIAGSSLLITVEDDGIGLRDRSRLKAPRTRGGYGLRNVRERMEAFFGEAYKLDIVSREEGGTSVEITMPLLQQQNPTEVHP